MEQDYLDEEQEEYYEYEDYEDHEEDTRASRRERAEHDAIFSKWALGTSIPAFLIASIYGITVAYANVCPQKGATSPTCAFGGLENLIEPVGIIALIIAGLIATVAFLCGVEGITRQRHQGKAYFSLALLAAGIIFYFGGIFPSIVTDVVYQVM